MIPDPPKYCRHYECQCERAAELAWMSDRLPARKTELLADAVSVHRDNLEVRCQRERKPRQGHTNKNSPNPPLPPRKE